MNSEVNKETRICLVAPNKETVSETFIKAQRERLAGKVWMVHGGWLPTLTEQDEALRALWEGGRWRRWSLKVRRYSKREIDEAAFIYYLQQQHIQVVLAEYGVIGAEICHACQTLKMPLIVHFHGFDAFLRPTLEIYRVGYAALFDYAAAIIGVSHAMLAQLTQLGAPAEKLVYNPYGPHDDFLQISPDFDALNFVAIGRFVEKKAPYLTIAAFHKVHRKYPEARLIMAGDGDLLPVCKDLARYWGIQDAVTFLGAVNHETVKQLYAKACCFLQHSITAHDGDSEGMPVSVLEASAAGLPVIATRHAGIPEVIVHEETGWLVEEKDVHGMAAYMEQIVKNRTISKTFGARGREHIRTYFSMERHIRVLNEVIHNILQEFNY